MARNKKDISDFDDMLEKQQEKIEDEYEFEFTDEEFELDKKLRHGRRRNTGHLIFFIVVVIILIGVGISLAVWNIGTNEDDVYVDEAEFDTEPNDYIQPMTTEQLAGKTDDGVTTILTIGNSTFADDGDDNYVAAALGEAMDAQIINVGIPGSQMSRSLEDDISVMNEGDGASLYYVTEALCSGDNSKVTEAAASMGDLAISRAERIGTVDMTTVDCVVIFYDITDYINRMLIYSPVSDDDIRSVAGALYASVSLLQEQYPYIRIVVMSPPASGVTIDDYYIDATYIDLGSGAIDDYMGRELEVAAGKGISYIDLMYGAITVDNRDEYIYDDYHINEAGAKVIAARFKKLISL